MAPNIIGAKIISFCRQFSCTDPVCKGLWPIIFHHFFAKGGKLIFHQENSLFSHGRGL
jgi:hypothetical protein